MSDPCTCTLYFPHGLAPGLIVELAKLCRSNGSDDDGNASYSFRDVNYGAMPDPLRDWFEQNHLAFAWANEAGDDYGPGVEIYDPESGELTEHATDSEQITLTLDQIDQPEVLRRAMLARDRWNAITRPHVNARLEHLSEGVEP